MTHYCRSKEASATATGKAGGVDLSPRGGQIGGSSNEHVEAMEIVPEPGFVIKTRNAKTQSKVFINVCCSSHIRPLSRKTQLADDGTEQEGILSHSQLGLQG